MYVIRGVNCHQLMLMVASVARQKSSRYLQIWSGKDGSAKEKFCPECPELSRPQTMAVGLNGLILVIAVLDNGGARKRRKRPSLLLVL